MFRVFATFYIWFEYIIDLNSYEKAFGLKANHSGLAVKVTTFVLKFLVCFNIIIYFSSC